MDITSDCVVQIQYTLKGDDGEVLDSSQGGEPLTYLQGHGNLIPGLERELEGKKAGDRLKVVIAPADGYGEYDERLVQNVPRSAIEGDAELQEGMMLHAQSDDDVLALTVTKLDKETATLDGNHPLAGKTLHFEVEVMGIRAATEEELAHGHVHGAGGHHH